MSSLFEVLISLVILSFGLLGLLSADTKALQQITLSEQVDQATLLLLDGASRQRLDAQWSQWVANALPKGEGVITTHLLTVQWVDSYGQRVIRLSLPRFFTR